MNKNAESKEELENRMRVTTMCFRKMSDVENIKGDEIIMRDFS